MIVCVKCGQPNEDHEPACRRCGWKLQSGRVVNREERRYTPMSAFRRDEDEYPLLSRAVEVVVASALLVGATGYGLYTGQWWPVLAAGALGVALILWRRK